MAARTRRCRLARDLPGPIAAISMRAWPADFPTTIAVQRRVPYESRADPVMYRTTLTKVDKATLDSLLANPKGDLTKILTYHVIPGQKLDADQLVKAGPITTVQGGKVTVSKSGNDDMVNGAKVICGNVSTANATVMIIVVRLTRMLPPSGLENRRRPRMSGPRRDLDRSRRSGTRRLALAPDGPLEKATGTSCGYDSDDSERER